MTASANRLMPLGMSAWRFKSQFSMGLRQRAQVNQARVSLDQIRTNKDQLLDSIKLGVKSAVFDLEAAQKLIEAQEGIVEQARKDYVLQMFSTKQGSSLALN